MAYPPLIVVPHLPFGIVLHVEVVRDAWLRLGLELGLG